MTMAVVLLLSGAAVPDAAQRAATPSAPQSARRADAASPRAAAQRATPDRARSRSPRGFATYYAKVLDGRRTASGIPFDNDAMVAAHPRYPFGTVVRVTNLSNGRSAEVRIVDRGPARRARANGVIIDLSRAAASKLGFITAGRARVRVDVLELPEDETS
jgi:rare lipoprotein A